MYSGGYDSLTNLSHRDNGLKQNGETFPILLPPNVSIQGTSALNTVFDLAGQSTMRQQGPIFEFGALDPLGVPASGENCVIDAISLTGAHMAPPGFNQWKVSTAIYIGDQVASSPTISNCFIFDNCIGMSVAAHRTDSGVKNDGTTVVSTTFAFNTFGLWNGQVPATPGEDVAGVSRLVLINDIFDGSWRHPNSKLPRSWRRIAPGTPAPAKCVSWGFAGVAQEDLTISSPIGGDYNAYEADPDPNVPAPYNRGYNPDKYLQFNPYALPHTNLRGGATQPSPTHNIGPYTGFKAMPPSPPFPWDSWRYQRGVLYIRDLLSHSLITSSPINDPGGTGSNYDASPMDFRLAPAAALSDFGPANSAPLVPSVLNPLVNAGWYQPISSSLQLVMANGLTRNRPPGHLELNQPQSWNWNSWIFDCEGYGNPRRHTHLAWLSPPYPDPLPDNMDIGADEVGDLIVAGYRYGTTSFVAVDSNNSPTTFAQDNKYLFYLGPPSGLAGSPPYTALPDYRIFTTYSSGPPPVPAAWPPAYGFLVTWHGVWSFDGTVPAPGYYTPSLANVMPHLLGDPHPWWLLVSSAGSNPNWEYCVSPPQYNYVLYWTPGTKVVHPPGAYTGGTATRIQPSGMLQYQWLDLLASVSPFFTYTLQLAGLLSNVVDEIRVIMRRRP